MNAVFLNIAAYDNKTETLGNCIFIGWSTASLIAQTFTEQKNTYPLSADGSKYVVNGFIPFSPIIDESIYANALLWTIKNVCSAQRDGINRSKHSCQEF